MSRLILGVLLLIGVVSPQAFAASSLPPCSQTVVTNCATSGTTSSGFTGTVTGTTDGQAAPAKNRPRGPKAPPSPTYVDRNFVPTCTGNNAYNDGALCGAAVESCPTEGDVRFWVFETTIQRSTGQPVAGTGPRLVDTVCLGPEDPQPDPAVLIPAMVQTEFQSVVVQGGVADVSPKPETLVNIDTRFQTDAPASYQIPLTLLGQSVVITALAQKYTWHLDNGETRVSTQPKGYLEYMYRQAGAYDVFVSITWSGTFSVNGGPAQPITGTVEVDGEPTRVQVQQARSELVRD
jgi:hypothetical protein